jgi:hypothetical protein
MTAAERLEALMTPRKRVIETTAPHRPLWAPPLASNTGIYLIESFEGGRGRLDEWEEGWDVAEHLLGPVKIGWAKNVEERVCALQVGNPNWLWVRTVLFLPPIYEDRLHEAFRSHHMRGEWFAPDDQLDALTFARSLEDALAVKRWLDDGSVAIMEAERRGEFVPSVDWQFYRRATP